MPSAKYIERPGGSRKSKGFIRSTYDSLTSSENASVVRSIAFFGVSVLPNPASDVRTPAPSGPVRSKFCLVFYSPILLTHALIIGCRRLPLQLLGRDARCVRIPLPSHHSPGGLPFRDC